MANTWGNNIKLSIYGESHGSAIGMVLDGLPSGFKIDIDDLNYHLSQRRPDGKLSTKRIEKDRYEITSGYFNGFTTGTPLHITIKNEDINSKVYDINQLRPSHADYTAHLKYHGYQDYRGSGHFSGRITTCLVLAGSICRQLLKSKDIQIASHIYQIHDVKDEPFSDDINILKLQMDKVSKLKLATINDEKKFVDVIEKAKNQMDSVGGIIETAIINYPKGLGDPYFNSIESILSHLLFSIPACKGVEFGLGFDFANYYGSQVNDALYFENGDILTKTNNNGGINGGISNGMPLKLKTVFKPTPSIGQKQSSVDYQTKENIEVQIVGRHDPCIVSRVSVIVDSVVAIGLLDIMMGDIKKGSFVE